MPFLIFLALLTLGTILVVPTVLRQSWSLAERVFKAESYQDLDRNGHWDPGESFIDLNGNGRCDDQSMFDRAMTWLKDYQARLRGPAAQEPDATNLAQFAPLVGTIRRDAAIIDELMAAAQADRDPGAWPKVDGDLEHGPVAWNPAWPGPATAAVAKAAERMGDEHRAWWLRAISTQGATLAGRYAIAIAGLRALRSGRAATAADLHAALAEVHGSLPSADASRIDEALCLTRPSDGAIPPEALAEAKALITRIVEEAGRNQGCASLLLDELRGGSEPQGLARWFAPVLESIETSAKGAVQALPQRLGDWAKASVGGFDWMSWASIWCSSPSTRISSSWPWRPYAAECATTCPSGNATRCCASSPTSRRWWRRSSAVACSSA